MFRLAVLTALPVAVGLVVGGLLGGSLRALPEARLPGVWLLPVAAVVQVVQHITGLPLLGLVFALVLAWLVLCVVSAPVGRVGSAFILVGALLNGAAIATNARMPYSPEAAVAAGLDPTTVTPKNVPSVEGTGLVALGDVLPVAPLGVVISIGDIAIAVGTVVLVARLMVRPQASRPSSTGLSVADRSPT